MIRGRLYRLVMKLAHKYHWHYAPPIYPDGDTQLWCKWCGFRETVHRRSRPMLDLAFLEETADSIRASGALQFDKQKSAHGLGAKPPR